MKKFDKSWGFKNRVQRYDFLHNFLIFVHKKLIFAKEKPNSALSNKQNGVILQRLWDVIPTHINYIDNNEGFIIQTNCRHTEVVNA